MADPKTKDEDQNAIPPETDWPKPNIWPPRQWPVALKQLISNFLYVVIAISVLILVPTIILGCFYLLGDIISLYTKTDDPDQFTKLRNSLFILAAMIGAPFLVWRTMLAAEQTKTAEKQANTAQEKAYTELFTQAVEQLGSVKPVEKDEFEANIEVRVGALYALERIMHDSDKDAPAIIDTLATYVKHNCGKPKNLPHNIDQNIITRLQERAPANRYDIQTALTIIGRRPPKYKTSESMPDLKDVNLQGADLVNFDLSLCNLANAHLNDTLLRGVEFQEAGLYSANLERANLHGANLQEANLRKANLQGADLWGTLFLKADLLAANFQEANLQGAKLDEVQINDVYMTAASAGGVNFTKCEYEFDKLQEQAMDMFGHKTHTILPDGMKVPDHWSEVDLSNYDGIAQYNREWEAFKKEKGVEWGYPFPSS